MVPFEPTAGEDGKPQAWLLDPAGGEPQQLTHVKEGIANLKPSPTGQSIAFTVDVKMDQEVPEIYADLPKADARLIVRFMLSVATRKGD